MQHRFLIWNTNLCYVTQIHVMLHKFLLFNTDSWYVTHILLMEHRFLSCVTGLLVNTTNFCGVKKCECGRRYVRRQPFTCFTSNPVAMPSFQRAFPDDDREVSRSRPQNIPVSIVPLASHRFPCTRDIACAPPAPRETLAPPACRTCSHRSWH